MRLLPALGPESSVERGRYRDARRFSTYVHDLLDILVDPTDIYDVNACLGRQVAIVEHGGRRTIIIARSKEIAATGAIDNPHPRRDLCS